ncbi:BlaI/MecI/CopY family transcriptional regulator [Mesoterricola sediminis]|uniref:Transcriptional regulator n=1 Tax=Mesoterricola sediminis TaxID=2927980 RepID=A0AA48KFQ8_9BACT|nr:BlaI/MecI/CopY family transcriptional regulator [Mesoterricola sediminis]BDU78547.1 transcriptional regulator [Mesoterricola sediminis]
MNHPLPRPTDGELAILRVLWDRGPSTVRQVHEVLSADKDLGYTTVLKLLQVMTDKGLVARDDRERSHVYRSAQSADATRAHLVHDLMDRAFGGSAAQLVMQALSERPASREELEAIRALLDGAEGRTS